MDKPENKKIIANFRVKEKAGVFTIQRKCEKLITKGVFRKTHHMETKWKTIDDTGEFIFYFSSYKSTISNSDRIMNTFSTKKEAFDKIDEIILNNKIEPIYHYKR